MAPAFWDRYSRDLKRSVLPTPNRPHPEHWPSRGLHAAWLGHSTVLLKIDGTVLITDPVFSTRVGLNFGPFTLGLKRLVEPALSVRHIPRPDIVLLSPAHMDHWDTPSLHALEWKSTRVVTPARTHDLLRVRGYGAVYELGWGQTAHVGDVSIRAFEVNHWGARMRSDTYRGYNGYLIETSRHRVIFGGDTALTASFRTVRSSRRTQLAIMPIGAYNPWIRAHCTPEQALRMADDAGADIILPVHHQTFQLSSEPLLEPIERLASATDRVALTEIGQEFHLF